jgi:hypothetical protein
MSLSEVFVMDDIDNCFCPKSFNDQKLPEKKACPR